IRPTLGATPEGGVILGPEQPRTLAKLDDNDKERYKVDVRATNIILQGLPKDIYKLINHNTEAKAIWDNVKMLLEGFELTKDDRESQLYDEFEQFKQQPAEDKMMMERFSPSSNDSLAFNSNYYKDKMLLMQAHENGATLDEEELLFLAGEKTNTFDADVDEAPTMFMANLSSVSPVSDEVGPSYAFDILFEVQDIDNDIDHVGEPHYKHEMHNDVQQNCVVDSDIIDTSNSNIIPYEQYVKDNEVPIVPNVVSSIQNDDEILKKELHSVKLQLNSTIRNNKLIQEKVTTLKDFKHNENKLLEDFIDMRNLKDKLKDKLYKKDQSIQTVHMLCKPKPFDDEENKMAIGYQNPLHLNKAKRVQPALYDGHEIVKTHHVPALVHNLEESLDVVETTRNKINKKMKTPLWTEQNFNIRPPNYSKENFLATFTPHTQLTLEQIFWSKDLLKRKFGALEEQATAPKILAPMT
ncbi:hypothetical protein Tco_1450958, partial [Tanacetum coccineum]